MLAPGMVRGERCGRGAGCVWITRAGVGGHLVESGVCSSDVLDCLTLPELTWITGAGEFWLLPWLGLIFPGWCCVLGAGWKQHASAGSQPGI